MPEWLRPTAEFGVGLQSAFLLTESFKCTTYTRSGERYEITFNSGASSQYGGYINVVPYEHFEKKRETYGTCFEVFVPLQKKYLHSESICTWSGSDPFSKGYDKTRILRHTAELISQMVLYLDGILGELLFPIKLKIENQDELNLALNRNEENMVRKIQYQTEGAMENVKRKTWIFREREESYFWGDIEKATFALEYDTAHLYIWAKEINAFCAISGVNLMRHEEEQRKRRIQGADNRGVKIFYKGIELQYRCIEEIEIFEFIDLKGSLERSCINISRRGFTAEGEKFFEENIYKKLIILVREILQFINKDKAFASRLKECIIEKIDTRFFSNEIALSDAEYHRRLVKLAEQLLSLAFLTYLTVKDVNDELSQLGRSHRGKEVYVWQEIIEAVNDDLRKLNNRRIKDELSDYSVLFDIQGYNCSNTCTEQQFTILDLFSNQNHFGILQRRSSSLDFWTTYIISIEQTVYEMFEKRMLSGIVKSANEAIDKEIEEWSKKLFSKVENIGLIVSDAHKYQQQFLLAWLLQNIPTIGIFGKDDNNIRLNILGNYIYPYIYTNLSHKNQILQKILKIAKEKKYDRFSTYAWQGQQYLAMDDVPFSCFFVKSGFLNKASMYRVIIPLEGNELRRIQNAIESVKDLEFVKDMKLLSQMLDIKDYFKKLMEKDKNDALTEKERMVRQSIEGRAKDLSKNYSDIGEEVWEFFGDLVSTSDEEPLSKDYFKRLHDISKEWYDCYLDVINLYTDTDISSEKVTNLKNQETFKFICKGWLFMKKDISTEILPYLQTEKLKKEYIQKCKDDVSLKTKNEKIIDYIVDNGRYKIRREQVEQCFEAFTDEIFEQAKKIECDRACEILANLR